MAQNEVEIVVRSRDESSRGFDSARASARRASTEGGSAIDGLTGKVKGLGVTAVATAALIGVELAKKAIGSLIDYSKRSISAASDLNESMNAVNKIFGTSAATINKWGKEQAHAFGLSQRAFNELATPLGALLKNQGVATDQLAGKTIELTKRAADMASVFNTDVSTALDAITSGLKGESDPLEQFGVSLNEAAVNAEAMRLGLVSNVKDLDKIQAAQLRAEVAQSKYNKAVREHGKDSDQAKSAQAALISANERLEKATEGSSGQISAQAKTAARLSLIMSQTSDVAGDFAGTSDQLANSTRILAARQEEVSAAFGQKLLPMMQKLTAFKLDALEYIAKHVMPAVEDGAKRVFEAFRKIWELALPKLRVLLEVIREKWEENRESIEKLKPFLEYLGIFLGVTLVAALVTVGGLIALFIEWLGNVGDTFQQSKRGFDGFVIALLQGFSRIIDGAAAAFGWIPGIGDKIKSARDKFHAFADGVINDLKRAQNQANQGVNVAIHVSGLGNLQSAANLIAKVAGSTYVSSGLSHRASGGISGGLTEVGERGGELMKLPQGTMVYSSANTNQMMTQGGGSVHVTIGFDSGGLSSDFDRMIMKKFRVKDITVPSGAVV